MRLHDAHFSMQITEASLLTLRLATDCSLSRVSAEDKPLLSEDLLNPGTKLSTDLQSATIRHCHQKSESHCHFQEETKPHSPLPLSSAFDLSHLVVTTKYGLWTTDTMNLAAASYLRDFGTTAIHSHLSFSTYKVKSINPIIYTIWNGIYKD